MLGAWWCYEEAARVAAQEQREGPRWSLSPEDWSIKEVAHHILMNSRSTRRVVSALAVGEAGDSSNVEPPRETPDASMDELREQIRNDSIEWSATIRDLPPTPPVRSTAPSGFGDLHARAWYLFQRTHEVDHIGQIAAVKAAQGYPGKIAQ